MKIPGIADRSKAIREALGYSQREMAVAAECSLGAWQSYEAGSTIPGGKILANLLHLGFSADWLLAGEGPMRAGHAAHGKGLDGYPEVDAQLQNIQEQLKLEAVPISQEKLRARSDLNTIKQELDAISS